AMSCSVVKTAGYVDVLRQRSFWGASLAFLWQLPALFYGYLATVLSCPGTQSFHAKHDDDCERLLFGRCCVGDHERSAFGFLDPKRLYDYSGTQNGNGNRLCNGRNRNGCLRAKAAHLPT